ncbi:MAG: preprotein translocase subunit SecE [Planctomycetaceae bacterium]|nr:MAG: preprotein translocase subunit SecE [Planctomycetaceae bacterium]
MSKDRVASTGMWFGELFQVGVYKRSQGRVTRQATFAALAIAVALGAWRFYAHFGPMFSPAVSYSAAGAILLLGLWISYRIVNLPRFADFLIAVEAEMNKVSWPSRTELYRASVVVIFVMLAMATLLFGFDLVWGFLFEWMGILKKTA